MNRTHLIESADITGAILKHMIHCEDLVLKGERAFHFGLDALQEELKRLNGQESNFKVTAKWDGAPAVIAASDYYGTKFVALKHSWDKGKVYHSIQEIEDNYKDNRPELSDKLTALFTKLDQIKIPKNEIWMGDYLFAHEDLRVMEIDGEDCLTFRPNTLVYAVPNDNSEFVQSIKNAEIGIVWHTKYVGTDFQNLQISFNVNVDELNKVDNIFQIDGRLQKVPVSLFTEEEYERLTEMLDDIENRFNDIIENYKDAYETLISDDKLCQILDRYRNILIRQGSESATYDGLIQHIENIAQTDIESKKSERGKTNATEKWNKLKAAINSDLLEKIYELQGWMVVVKEALISKENSLQTIKSYVETRDAGIIPASGEGYAISDANGNIQKFVSRLGFSAANFSDNVIKGWEKLPKTTESVERTWNAWERILEAAEEEPEFDIDPIISLLAEIQGSDYATDYGFRAVDLTPVSLSKEKLKKSPDLDFRLKKDLPSGLDLRQVRNTAYKEIKKYIDEQMSNWTCERSAYGSEGNPNAGSHMDWVKIFYNQNGKKTLFAKIVLRTSRTGGRNSGIGLLLSSKFLDKDQSNYVIDNSNLQEFLTVLFENLEKMYPNDIRVKRIYEYFFLENIEKKLTARNFPEDVKQALTSTNKQGMNIGVNLAELLTPYWILLGCDLPDTDLVPEEFKGMTPIAIEFPKNGVNGFTDSAVVFAENPDNKLNISSKAAVAKNATVGSTAFLPILKALTKKVFQTSDPFIQECTAYKFEKIRQACNEIFSTLKKKYSFMKSYSKCNDNGVPTWVYGAQKTELGKKYTVAELCEHYYKFLACYKKYLGQTNDPDLQEVLPGNKLFKEYQSAIGPKICEQYNTAVSNAEKAQGKRFSKNFKIDIPRLEQSFPLGISTVLSQFTAFDLETDPKTKQLVADELGNINYYQYKLTLKNNSVEMIISKAGKNDNAPGINNITIFHQQVAYNGSHIFTHNGKNLSIEVK